MTKEVVYAAIALFKLFFFLPITICYLLGGDKRKLINYDLDYMAEFQNRKVGSHLWAFIMTFAFDKAFRNVVYHRLKPWSFILRTLPGQRDLTLNIPPGCLGPGFFVHHGHSTRISARRIGSKFNVHHNCTVAHGKGGTPEIGDNVFIGTGAVVVGKIRIGNNVKIGANALVVKDIPDNCIVVAGSSRIIRKDGLTVDIVL